LVGVPEPEHHPATAALGRIAALVRQERDRAERRLAPFGYRDWLNELLAQAEHPAEAESGAGPTQRGGS
jgi:hypothetical protein